MGSKLGIIDTTSLLDSAVCQELILPRIDKLISIAAQDYFSKERAPRREALRSWDSHTGTGKGMVVRSKRIDLSRCFEIVHSNLEQAQPHAVSGLWKKCDGPDLDTLPEVLKKSVAVHDGKMSIESGCLFQGLETGSGSAGQESTGGSFRLDAISLTMESLKCVKQTDDASFLGFGGNDDDIALRWLFIDQKKSESVYPPDGSSFWVDHFATGDDKALNRLIHTFPVFEEPGKVGILQAFLQLAELDQGGFADASGELFAMLMEVAGELAIRVAEHYVDPVIQAAVQDAGTVVGAALGGAPGAIVGNCVGAIAGVVACYFVNKIIESVMHGMVDAAIEGYNDDLFSLCPFLIAVPGVAVGEVPQDASQTLDIYGADGHYQMACGIKFHTRYQPPPRIERVAIEGCRADDLEFKGVYHPEQGRLSQVGRIRFEDSSHRIHSPEEDAAAKEYCASCKAGYAQGGFLGQSMLPPCMVPPTLGGTRCPGPIVPLRTRLKNLGNLRVVATPIPSYPGTVVWSACCEKIELRTIEQFLAETPNLDRGVEVFLKAAPSNPQEALRSQRPFMKNLAGVKLVPWKVRGPGRELRTELRIQKRIPTKQVDLVSPSFDLLRVFPDLPVFTENDYSNGSRIDVEVAVRDRSVASAESRQKVSLFAHSIALT